MYIVYVHSMDVAYGSDKLMGYTNTSNSNKSMVIDDIEVKKHVSIYIYKYIYML
jgi:hypothetical protein